MEDRTFDKPRRARSCAKLAHLESDNPIPDVPTRPDFGLLAFEKQIVTSIVEGYSTAISAKQLGISEPALAQQLVNIYAKLQVSNAFELLLFAVYHQMVDSYVRPAKEKNSYRQR